jgi:hypothetical protein
MRIDDCWLLAYAVLSQLSNVLLARLADQLRKMDWNADRAWHNATGLTPNIGVCAELVDYVM